MSNPLTPAIEWYRSLGPFKRRAAIAGAALLAGVLLVPWFIYLAGRATLGDYGRGGPFALWADFFRGLFDLSFAYWLAALGPLIIVALWTLWRKLTS